MRVVPGFDEFEDRDPGFELCLETMTVEMRWEGGKRTGEESNFEFTFRRGPVFSFRCAWASGRSRPRSREELTVERASRALDERGARGRSFAARLNGEPIVPPMTATGSAHVPAAF